MASGKKNYFRHSFFAVDDEKIQKIIDEMGFEGYGYYFSLIELCGRQCSDGPKNPIIFHIQTIRKVWRKNQESAKKVLRKLSESGLFLVTFSEHSVILDIPNLRKYLGKYDSKTPNEIKENKRKEKEIKDNNQDEKKSPISFLFSHSPEIQKWLNEGTFETHLLLLKKYQSHHELVDLVEKAFAWGAPKNKRAESWLYTFVSNKITNGFGLNSPKKQKTTPTPSNPTGNPYLEELRQKYGDEI